MLSLIIPVYNGAVTLPNLFAALQQQTRQPDEILIADSESTDDSLAICCEYGANIITIAHTEFNHATTRTLLAQKAKGDLLLYCTQDAIFAKDNAIEHLIAACNQQKDIACAYGRQLPSENATRQAAALRRFNYPEISQTRSMNDADKYGLKTAFISNSFALYKKDILTRHGFFGKNIHFGEDTCTLGQLLLAGYSVAYCAEAAVIHSHNYTLIEEFRRSVDIGALHQSQRWLLEHFGGAAKIGGDFVWYSLRDLLEHREYILVGDWFIRNALKFLGYKLGKLQKE